MLVHTSWYLQRPMSLTWTYIAISILWVCKHIAERCCISLPASRALIQKHCHCQQGCTIWAAGKHITVNHHWQQTSLERSRTDCLIQIMQCSQTVDTNDTVESYDLLLVHLWNTSLPNLVRMGCPHHGCLSNKCASSGLPTWIKTTSECVVILLKWQLLTTNDSY